MRNAGVSRKRQWAVAAGLALVLSGALWAAPARYPKAFYAEFDLLQPGSPRAVRKVRLYVTPQAVRLDRAGGDAVLLYDPQRDRTTVVFPLRREYMVVPGASEVEPFLPVPGGNPCGAGGLRSAPCRRVGFEPVAGRPAVKWEVGSGALLQRVWVDRELGLVLRRWARGADTVVARTVRLGPQPEKLFEVPRGYRKVG